jgi:hypothetical protein
VGARTVEVSSALPWTIDGGAQRVEQAWSSGDCAHAIELSGYLAHYIGDASQPLHTTRYYDGFPQDRGCTRGSKAPWIDPLTRWQN